MIARRLTTFALSISLACTAHAVAPDALLSTFEDGGEYDVRLERGASKLDARKAAAIAAARGKLEREVGAIEIAASPELGTPELVAVPPTSSKALADSNGRARVDVLRDFIATHPALYGVDDASTLTPVADYRNPGNALAFVHLEQRIAGLPVFRGEVKAAFDAQGRLFRTIGQLAPDIDADDVRGVPRDPESSLRSAAATIRRALPLAPLDVVSRSDGKTTFATAALDDRATVEAIVFPLAPGVARLAHRVTLSDGGLGWLVIVDAETGELLFRTCLTRFQTQAATYTVYPGTSPAPGPAGGPASPDGSQPPATTRVNVTRIGNEAPYTFNNLGWIPDGGNTTAGNNAIAGIDRIAPDGPDVEGIPVGIPARTFTATYNPGPGNPAPGQAPLDAYPPLSEFQRGSVANAFYWVNVFHDEAYRLGFTEQARNFQNDNFGRGGLGGDRISVEVQDLSGSNNANFFAPADGTPGRLQLYVWTGPAIDRDGALDQTVTLHELTHAISRRVVGNAAGLTTAKARAIDEGWADFFARAFLAQPTDPLSGRYPIGAYAIRDFGPGGENVEYYGIRGFPLSRIASVGPNGRPHNPLTLRDMDPAQRDFTDGAYPRGPIGGGSELFLQGEVWAAVLWEVYAQLVDTNGFAEGRRRAMQYTVDGMKLVPLNPTFLQARDAFIAAAVASGHDPAPVLRGFALRGWGPDAVEEGTVLKEPLLSNGFE